jgi:DNA-binding sugar fermentation-stimulating protein
MIGINTGCPNALVAESDRRRDDPASSAAMRASRRSVAIGEEASRVDFVLERRAAGLLRRGEERDRRGSRRVSRSFPTA